MTGDEFLSAIAASLPVTWQDWALLIAAVVAALGIIGWVINLVNERQSSSGNRARDLRLNLPEEKPDPDLEESEYMPLRAALRRLYAETSDSAMAAFARSGAHDNPDEIIQWYGWWCHEKKLPIYGKRPPSQHYELLPDKEFSRGFFIKGAKEFRRTAARIPSYTELAVKKEELKAMWEALKQLDDDHDIPRMPS